MVDVPMDCNAEGGDRDMVGTDRPSIGSVERPDPMSRGSLPDSEAPSIRLRYPIEAEADRLTARIGSMPGAALLEGGPSFGDTGRWSLLAARPRLRFSATDDRWTLEAPGQMPQTGRGDPLAALERLIRRLGLDVQFEEPDGPDRPPFLGGLIGFYAYDLAPRIERLPRRFPRESRLPDLAFGLYDTFVAIDHRRGEAALWVVGLRGESRLALERRATRWRAELDRPAPQIRRSRFDVPPTPTVRPEAHRDAVRQAIEFIHAGEIFQANISQRFEALGTPEPLDLHRRLRSRSPAPYAAFLRWAEDLAVVSSSPELFFDLQGDRIVTKPIKGTRPRGATPEEDAHKLRALQASPKDHAELVMIVDLERNDLGRVCRPGTVVVTAPAAIESFATVHHQVATIEGRLRSHVSLSELIRAIFPGGSITGAPKIRAMEIIDELEANRRGVYTGAIGFHGLGGRACFNIAIRTLTVEGARVAYQVGGGIVADSDPDGEYEETLHKGRAMRDVLEERS